MFAKLGLLFISLFVAPAALAAPTCMRPNAEDLLEQSQAAIHFTASYFFAPTAKFLPLTLNGRSLQWMGASWEGPEDGALFVLNCKGRELAAMRLGHIEYLQKGPTISDFGQTAEAIYAPGEATGDQSYQVSLVAFIAGSVVVLWTHEASETVNMPDISIAYTDSYSWRYHDGGALIRVNGKRTVGQYRDEEHGWNPGTTHLFPTETFCWKPRQHTYLSCKGD